MEWQNEENKEHFPPAMLDMGMPMEMSPIDQITNAYNEVPTLEVTQPIRAHEMNELHIAEENDETI